MHPIAIKYLCKTDFNPWADRQLAEIEERAKVHKYQSGEITIPGTFICDNCGKELYTRDDDKLSAVTQRLEVYRKQTEPLIAYYKKTGLLKDLDASQNPQATREQAAGILESL